MILCQTVFYWGILISTTASAPEYVFTFTFFIQGKDLGSNSDPPDESYSYEKFLPFSIYKSQTVENVRKTGVRISLDALRRKYFTLYFTLTIHRKIVFHCSNLTEIYLKIWTPSPTFVSLLECSICDWKKAINFLFIICKVICMYLK